MDFSNALKLIVGGTKMSRTEWGNPEDTVTFEDGKLVKTVTLEKMYPEAKDKEIKVAWAATSDDLLARDWEIMR